jgi:hypothetical protein
VVCGFLEGNFDLGIAALRRRVHGVLWSNRMSIYRRCRCVLRRREWIETSRREFKHGHNLFLRQVKPLHDFIDRGSGF